MRKHFHVIVSRTPFYVIPASSLLYATASRLPASMSTHHAKIGNGTANKAARNRNPYRISPVRSAMMAIAPGPSHDAPRSQMLNRLKKRAS